jgi:hypothetical protein
MASITTVSENIDVDLLLGQSLNINIFDENKKCLCAEIRNENGEIVIYSDDVRKKPFSLWKPLSHVTG